MSQQGEQGTFDLLLLATSHWIWPPALSAEIYLDPTSEEAPTLQTLCHPSDSANCVPIRVSSRHSGQEEGGDSLVAHLEIPPCVTCLLTSFSLWMMNRLLLGTVLVKLSVLCLAWSHPLTSDQTVLATPAGPSGRGGLCKGSGTPLIPVT